MKHGFELIREDTIPEYDIKAELYRHVKTGAEVLSFLGADENKVFGITFRTPPRDSTGVAHILEHSVLCGSRKYPVKEPFVELLKGSLQTFLNAFTYPDKTCYPVASTNLQDFYNLVDVYLDAVFHPNITEHIFRQEGWHYELDDPSGPMTYKGVVYNEMKGVYSSPDSILSEKSQQSLFPDTTYGLDSGGDPKAIPSLTYEDFVGFHRCYYHPSNARAFFYGDDDPDRRLAILDEYFREYERQTVESEVGLQPHLGTPRRVEASYGAGPDQADKGMVTMNWLLPETLDARLALELDILEYILVGLPASPLRKALIDSDLGEDVTGGLEGELRQMYFSTGLKGIVPGTEEKVEAVVRDTLAGLVRESIQPDMVEAAVNSMEFALRENNTGSFPRGLSLMLRSLTTWLYGGDPLAPLRFEDHLTSLKGRLAGGERVFEALIDRYLIGNAHRTTVVLRPDTGLLARMDQEEADRLDKARQSMSENDLRRIAEETVFLKELQATPDSAEALATIPSLALADLPRENKLLPLEEVEIGGVRTYFHDLPTNGILYLDLGFDLHSLPLALVPALPLFGRALLEMGTQREDYVTFLQRVARKTGGIRRELFTSALKTAGAGESAAWMFLRAKATVDNAGELLAILTDSLTTARFDDRDRFRQMVLEARARQEQRIVPAGHSMVNSRLRARFSEADFLSEAMHGVSNLFWTRELVERIERDWDSVHADLEEIRRLLLHRGGLIVNATLDRPSFDRVAPQLESFLGGLPVRPVQEVARQVWTRGSFPAHEGLASPAQVNYVGKGANIFQAGYVFHGSAQVISRYLRTGYLWDRVRVQGGAYGAFCSFDRLSGAFSFVSYRDPCIVPTLEIYDQAAEFLRSCPIEGDELTKAVIGAIGDMDAYMLPDAKGFVSMARRLWGETDADRQRMREDILGTTVDHFRQFADAVAAVARKGDVVVLGSPEALAEVAVQGDKLALTRVL